ncbi:MAG: phosphoribosylglycinamide formyltransferase [Christensenellales bacterium]|jgi:phosphoribosylglycinamide formyltransferase-1
MNITVFASHGGTDCQAIMDGCASGEILAKVSAVICNNAGAPVLERAARMGVPGYRISRAQFKTCEGYEAALLRALGEADTDLIFLAGYMKKLPDAVLERYENRVMNIHPALLPKFGGQGMYGMHVHRAVLAAGDTETGVTIHRVTHQYDAGEIIAQTKVPVLPGDTPETLAARVLEREHRFLVEVLSRVARGDIPIS